MEVSTLLDQLETMTNSGRMRFMVSLGAESRGNAATALIVAELCRGSSYERFLALETVYGSGDIQSRDKFSTLILES